MSFGVRFTQKNGTLHLTHIEDQARFDDIIEALDGDLDRPVELVAITCRALEVTGTEPLEPDAAAALAPENPCAR